MRRHFLSLLFAATTLLAVSPPCRAEAPSDSVYSLGVEMASGDFVRYRRPDGSVGCVSANRVAHIRDAAGTDKRDVVLGKRLPLGAPIRAKGSKYRSLSFRGGDRSKCASFLLTEAGVMLPLDRDGTSDAVAHLDLGWMKNVGSRSAVGATGFWERGNDDTRAGLRFRYRRWLGRDLSVELSPGIVMAGNGSFEPPGFIGQAAFNAGDLRSVVVETEVDHHVYPAYGWSGTARESTETSFRVGVRAGSYVGFFGAVAVTLVAGAWATLNG